MQIVDSISSNDFIEENQITPEIVKIDVEGLEYDVLLGLEDKINICKCIILECHFDNVYNNHDVGQIEKFMKKNNFVLASAVKFPFMQWEDRI